MDEIPFKEEAQSQTRGGLTVTAAVLSREQAEHAFGVDIAKQQIQPIWFEVRNDSDVPYAFLMTGVDPHYFSAREAAYKSHFRWRPSTNRKMDEHFGALSFDPDLAPHSQRSGFVFTHLKLGTKEVRVRFFGPSQTEEFEFYFAVSGFRADYQDVAWETLLNQEFIDYTSEDDFRIALERLPCCTSREDGTGEGDPINLVVIGGPNEVGEALTRAGWDETEELTAGSAWRSFKGFFGGEYKYSPMSSLYIYKRAQDAGFQTARETIHQRNHLRLWLSPIKFRGKQVFVGTVSRDIGVYFTRRTWNLTSHAIDPEVDEARSALAEDFITSRSIKRFGYVDGVGRTSRREPRHTLLESPWWSDGGRLVVELSDEPVPMDKVDFFHWGWSEYEEEIKSEQRLRGD